MGGALPTAARLRLVLARSLFKGNGDREKKDVREDGGGCA